MFSSTSAIIMNDDISLFFIRCCLWRGRTLQRRPNPQNLNRHLLGSISCASSCSRIKFIIKSSENSEKKTQLNDDDNLKATMTLRRYWLPSETLKLSENRRGKLLESDFWKIYSSLGPFRSSDLISSLFQPLDSTFSRPRAIAFYFLFWEWKATCYMQTVHLVLSKKS